MPTSTSFRVVCLVALPLVLATGAAAAPLDKEGDLRLGLRTYAATRIGTEAHDFIQTEEELGGTFPASPAGNVRQMRGFVEASLDHKLDRLIQKGFGPLSLLRHLPVRVDRVGYHLTFRGEYEGIYDFGPNDFSTADANRALVFPLSGRMPEDAIARQRRDLRNIASHRERLFQAYVEARIGDVHARFGRQILAWGETDGFRVLDNINPLDFSFGGFLLALDERRVPLDMLRLSYYLGRIGSASEVYLEGYVAIDDEVTWNPGIPAGSPWGLPTLGLPNTLVYPVLDEPNANFEDARGGAQLKLNHELPVVGDVTFGLAHFYTYLDLPAAQMQLARGALPGLPAFFPDDDPDGAGFPTDDPDGDGIPDRSVGAIAKLVADPELTQITGLSATFALPLEAAHFVGISSEPIIRLEAAYFHDEPRYRQLDFEPLRVLNSEACRAAKPGEICSGNRRVGDSWNIVVGVDINQYIRWLNPNQSFIFSTQFFYKHLIAAAKRQPLPPARFRDLDGLLDGEIAPVPNYLYTPTLQFDMARNPVDQYLQTFIATTSYMSGQVTPTLILFYDWYGAFLAQPQVTFSRDPVRFTVAYSAIEASKVKGASGISILRDRDNVLFQIEYVL